MKNSWKTALLLFFVLALTVICYWPGLQGGFLFDDFHNLDDLGSYGGVRDLETLRAFVFGGISGPTGRPLSLLSFLLDDNTWPSHAPWFKSTNLLIHLVTGLLLCWATLLLLRTRGIAERSAQWLAIFSSACWMLHPLMVSTTLYVVQRMAQLSTLFIFLGLVGYLHGRSLLAGRPKSAYAWMSLSLAVCGLLSLLSKENGVLLPLLVLVLEIFLPREPARPGPALAWRALFLYAPVAALLAYLANRINFSPDAWPTRSFTQPERLLSEARILWEYLRLLYVPQIEGRGLYQDGYHISTGWLTPWTTLPAVLGIAALLVTGLLARRRYPLLALALLFFLAAHVLESSVIGLELYFEHRNYLAAAFLFLPLASGLAMLRKHVSTPLVVSLAALLLSLLSFLTWQRASLWADSEKLEMYWVAANPDSPRAQNALATRLMNMGQVEQANAVLDEAIKRMPHSALLNMRKLLQKVYSRTALPEDFRIASERMQAQRFDGQAVAALRLLVGKVLEPGTPAAYLSETLTFVEKMETESNFNRVSIFNRLAPYLKARLLLKMGQVDAACASYELAISRYKKAEAALLMVAEAGSGGAATCALRLLNQAEQVLKDQSDKDLTRSRSEYEKEISYLKILIQSDMNRESGEKKE